MVFTKKKIIASVLAVNFVSSSIFASIIISNSTISNAAPVLPNKLQNKNVPENSDILGLRILSFYGSEKFLQHKPTSLIFYPLEREYQMENYYGRYYLAVNQNNDRFIDAKQATKIEGETEYKAQLGTDALIEQMQEPSKGMSLEQKVVDEQAEQTLAIDAKRKFSFTHLFEKLKECRCSWQSKVKCNSFKMYALNGLGHPTSEIQNIKGYVPPAFTYGTAYEDLQKNLLFIFVSGRDDDSRKLKVELFATYSAQDDLLIASKEINTKSSYPFYQGGVFTADFSATMPKPKPKGYYVVITDENGLQARKDLDIRSYS